MIIGSHNSWSYKTPINGILMKIFAFMGKCQRKDIIEQYENYNVRCFDLRIRFKEGIPYIVHNNIVYCTFENIQDDLKFLNKKKDVSIRIIHDVRTKSNHTEENIELFRDLCKNLKKKYKGLNFWCGRNLYDWQFDFEFGTEPNCIEKYSSVCPPKYIDDWIPILYAKIMNKSNIKKYENEDCILLIDYIDIR